MKSAITLAQVPEAKAGPFVFHEPLEEGFASAAQHGFDAVELFLPGPDHVSVDTIKALQEKHGLAIAAVGTGAGAVKHGLSLPHPDADHRAEAIGFIERMIDFGGQLGAPAILGSMQGRWGGDVSRDQALSWLADALNIAGEAAAKHNVPFIYEPLNRYETNLINHLGEAAGYLEANNTENVVLLADLFHMNIEEANVPQAIRDAAPHVGHVHFADSNRSAIGFGHTDIQPIVDALAETGYTGYLAAEVFPLPDPQACAAQTITAFRNVTGA